MKPTTTNHNGFWRHEGLYKGETIMVRTALRKAWKTIADFLNSVTKTKAGALALIAVVMLLGILLNYVILPAIFSGTPLLGSQEYKAYKYAKKEAKKNFWHITKFPSYSKTTIYQNYSTPSGVTDCKKSWTISGTMICENKMRMETYVDFEATVVKYSYGAYRCVSFTYE